MAKGKSDKDGGFWDFALAYYEHEPLIANAIIIITVITPLVLGWFRYLINKEKEQTEQKKNILAFKAKVYGKKGK